MSKSENVIYRVTNTKTNEVSKTINTSLADFVSVYGELIDRCMGK